MPETMCIQGNLKLKKSQNKRVKQLDEKLDINIKKIESLLKNIQHRFVSLNMGTTENKTLCYKRNQEVIPNKYYVVVSQKSEIWRSM